ncbi:MAG: hypothetical protein KC996_11485 [Phycisphaerales bacterium]|nr:hypothetical protein [Phycisphaerales bacterium]
MSSQLDHLIRLWSTLGAGFDARPVDGPIDLERLLLETARRAPAMSRLFIMAATWLHTYGDLVAKHRLKRLIRDELESEHQPVLGLLLDIAQQGTHPLEFQSVIKLLDPAEEERPLFESNRKNPKLAGISEERASALSRKWGLWCQPIEFKTDALRPAAWMIQSQPQLRTRADFRGDLRASILAALRHDEGAGHSESRLAQMAGGSRAQLRNALGNLRMTNRVEWRRAINSRRSEIWLTNHSTNRDS